MKYRIIEYGDGTFRTQQKTLFWWDNTGLGRDNTLEEALKSIRHSIEWDKKYNLSKKVVNITYYKESDIP